MPPSGDLLPAWFDRAGTLLLLTVAGTIAAFVSSGVLLALAFGDGELFVASIANHPLVVLLSAGCGVVVGIDHVWTWDVGMINDAIGPGDGGRLYVIFDPSNRVMSGKVDTSL